MNEDTDKHQRSIVWKTAMLFVFALFLLSVFQSSALLTLAYDLPPNPQSEAVIGVVETWHTAMQAIGTAGFTDAVAENLEAVHQKPVVVN